LTREIIEKTGKSPRPAELVMIDQIAFLMASRKGDRVRNVRAIVDALAALDLLPRVFLGSKPKPVAKSKLPKLKTLRDHLAARGTAAGKRSELPGSQTPADGKSSPAAIQRSPEGIP
jgi:hypothetical protein